MDTVGIRELKQNASAVVAQVAAGETLAVTVRGQPVARLSPLASSPLEQLIEDGLARPARAILAELPTPAPGPPLSETLRHMRDDERY